MAAIQHVALSAVCDQLFPAGWSRYDHFASLCELLPVALPSLILRYFCSNLSYSLGHDNKYNFVIVVAAWQSLQQEDRIYQLLGTWSSHR